jgi:hypothetical protein
MAVQIAFVLAMFAITAGAMTAVVMIANENIEKNKAAAEAEKPARRAKAADAFPEAAENAKAAVDNAIQATKQVAEAEAKLAAAKTMERQAQAEIEDAERRLGEAKLAEMVAKGQELNAFRQADWLRAFGQVADAPAYDELREQADVDRKIRVADDEAWWLGVGIFLCVVLVAIVICGAIGSRR